MAEAAGRGANRIVGDAVQSFTRLLQDTRPELLPPGGFGGSASGLGANQGKLAAEVPHATTIVALTFAGGVLMAGDRRATIGNTIASRRIEKVFPADSYSVVGIAGTAGIAMDLTRLFQVELEHFEKIEGALLSVDGKANRLGAMIRSNMPLALQGQAVVPLFAGFDLTSRLGRLFSYDVTGGRYEEHEHHAVGSGAAFARGALKRLFSPNLSETEAIRVSLEALFDASDDDSATGAPDIIRNIYPVVYVVTNTGARRIGESELARLAKDIVRERTESGEGL